LKKIHQLIMIYLFLKLFYQIKGDMCLKIVEQNQHRDIIIKEGEVKKK